MMKLQEILHHVGIELNHIHAHVFGVYPSHIDTLLNKEVTLQTDSRCLTKTDLFIPLNGTQKRGRDFVPEALSLGALVLADTADSDFYLKTLKKNEFVFHVRGLLEKAPKLIAKYFSEPTTQLFIVGVTGTNGKTSTTYIVEHLLNSFKIPTGIIGTVDHHLGSKVWKANLTTPNQFELQSRVHEMVTLGAKAAALEVTSHALNQGRVNEVQFDIAVFTNLTQDHLDYHGTMESYFDAKLKLFTHHLKVSTKKNKIALVCRDDEWGKKLEQVLKGSFPEIKTYTYGLQGDFSYKIIESKGPQTVFELSYNGMRVQAMLPMIGEHFVKNASAAIASCFFGIKNLLATPTSQSKKNQLDSDFEILEKIVSELKNFKGVPGRMQLVQSGVSPHFYVDYAHTPDALERSLKSLKSHHWNINSKLFVIFGCGGDRDRSKRPLMGKIADQIADIVVLTSDNPRTEEPKRIIDEIITGINRNDNLIIEPDREKAIHWAVQNSKIGDVILVAGKGHEDYQIIGTQKKYFSDHEIILRAIRERKTS